MNVQAIHKSGFFKAFIEEYINLFDYRLEDHHRLIYALCNSEEEKRLATLEEIAAIKNRIKSLGNEDISWSFLLHYKKKPPVPGYEAQDEDSYWINDFNDCIVDRIISFTPYSEFGLKFDEFGEKEYPYYARTGLNFIERIDGRILNLPFLIQCEEEIMEEIEEEIKYFKRDKYWDIDIYFFEGYINVNIAVKQLFNLCELYAQIFMLREVEGWLDFAENAPDEVDFIKKPDKEKLLEYGFLDLSMVKEISIENHIKLFDFICSNKIPYSIAFLDHLGFFSHLEKVHFPIKSKMYLELSKWFCCSSRSMRGYINSLNDYSTENKDRYTAHIHTEQVKKDYLSLK